MPGHLYVVAGDHFYRITYPPGVPTGIEDLGSVGVAADPFGLVTIAVGMLAVVVCVPPNAFTCSHGAGAPLNQLGGTFPAGGATAVAHLDGYFAFVDYTDNTKWFISGLLDPIDYDALDFAYADSAPNVLRTIVGHRGELWLVGEKAIEVWYDSGDADFPFRRRSAAVIAVGALTPRSVQAGAESVWWIGNDNVVYRSNGYVATRVSNSAIEARITGMFIGDDALDCLFYKIDGHSFYVFSVAGDLTWAYDAGAGTWHERSSTADGNGRWRANCATQLGGEPILGDFNTGQLMRLVRASDNDIGVPLMRQAVLPPLAVSSVRGARSFCARLEVEMEVGTGASHQDVTLDWSDDGGQTWVGGRLMGSGPIGNGRKRVFTTRLGSFRQRTFRITTRGAATLWAVDADITPGAY